VKYAFVGKATNEHEEKEQRKKNENILLKEKRP